jgi:hypothetical protein
LDALNRLEIHQLGITDTSRPFERAQTMSAQCGALIFALAVITGRLSSVALNPVSLGYLALSAFLCGLALVRSAPFWIHAPNVAYSFHHSNSIERFYC